MFLEYFVVCEAFAAAFAHQKHLLMCSHVFDQRRRAAEGLVALIAAIASGQAEETLKEQTGSLHFDRLLRFWGKGVWDEYRLILDGYDVWFRLYPLVDELLFHWYRCG